jgi:hypothetical protein
MALVKCKECGGDVSTQARACPKCGRIRQTSLNPVTVILLVIPIGFVVLWAMMKIANAYARGELQ